uniref:SEC24 homolog B, COPII coat complex component n=1 Tax=Ornithorhynchus anatinus TaxID=9258 RepID=A0A6I8N7E9_ORNAN
MWSPGGPPRPDARTPASLGGGAAAAAAAAGPGPARPVENGPGLNPLQSAPGYGFHPPNSAAPPSGPSSSQMARKTSPLQPDGQYVPDYYSARYPAPTQHVVAPPPPHPVGSGAVHTAAGSRQAYGRGPPAHLHASAPHPYTAPGNHYGGPAAHSAAPAMAPQGFPSSSGQPAAAHPSVPYPSVPPGNPYGPGFTSQSASLTRQLPENSFPGQNAAVAHPPNATVAHPPRQQQQQHPPPQRSLGYGASSWPASGVQSSQDDLLRNHTGSVAAAGNSSNTVAGSPSRPTNQSVQRPKACPASSSGKPQAAPGQQPTQPGAPLSHPSDPSVQEAIDSSSTTSSASPVPNNYDALEGGGYPETLSSPTSSPAPAPSTPQPAKTSKPFGYGYPTLQPGYQNAAPLSSGTQPSNPGYHSGFQQYAQQYPGMNQLSSSLGGLSLQHSQQPESLRPVNLTQDRNILPTTPVLAPVPNLNADLKKLNCSPDSFRCTLTNIPQTQALLNKAKLPLGLLLHPFRDLTQLPVITSSTIVRCRSCRTYINPFVSFIDQRRWKCNLCYRVNDVPEEFMYNPLSRSYGEPHKRPEVQNSTVEFIASSDYMLRPPQPAVYLFVLDVSHNAVEAGYLNIVCQSLLENLDKLPGDSRTRIGFVTFDSTVQFYNLQEGLSQPQMLVVSDIEDIFLPTPDSLLVNLHESKELIKDLLNALPNMFTNTRETHSALGPALQAAFKLMSPTGGRVSVFQTQLPSLGVGLLQSREDPNQRSSTKVVQHLGPATDFYKKLALDCSGQQTAVDLFLLSSQYSDLASLACMSKYSAGCIYYYPSFHHSHNPAQAEKLQKDLKRYLTRKIGFEAVMRIRCTKGLSIHTFHGNFFVRSTDLLSLANINPDAGFAVQMSIEESLADTSLVCFQTALLYTSSKGERRIRVHTLCLPVVSALADVYAGVDVQAAICLLANMAVDRSVSSSLSDARDALVNAVVDSLSAYSSTVSNWQQSAVIAPSSLKLFPLYVLALLKQKAFRTGTSTRLDDRVFAMCQMKSQPLVHLMKMIHPNLYRVDRLTDESSIHVNDRVVPQPPLQKLSAEKLTREGAFLMDCGSVFYIWIGKSCDTNFIKDVLGYPNSASVPQKLTHLPELDTLPSERARSFLSWLRDSRPLSPILHVVKDESPAKTEFFHHLVEDRTEAAFSYYEFLLHVQQQLCK